MEAVRTHFVPVKAKQKNNNRSLIVSMIFKNIVWHVTRLAPGLSFSVLSMFRLKQAVWTFFVTLFLHVIHWTLNTRFYFHSIQVQTMFKFKALDKCKNSITVSKLLYFSHLHAFELFSEAEIGAAVLVIKAEETKQQISRLNDEVMSFCGGWRILTMIQGMLKNSENLEIW